MSIENLQKVCNKRNCVERLLLEKMSDAETINELVSNYLNYCNLKKFENLFKLNDEYKIKVLTYSIYTSVLNNYVRRDNVCYQNMHQILKMLDKSKDTIRLVLNDTNTINSLDKNMDEFISWTGVSNSFDLEFRNTFNFKSIVKYLQKECV